MIGNGCKLTSKMIVEKFVRFEKKVIRYIYILMIEMPVLKFNDFYCNQNKNSIGV